MKDQTKTSGVNLSPIKIIKNPEESMQRAAMTQSQLAKERKDLREQQKNAISDTVPKDINKPWKDPMADSTERHIVQELCTLGNIVQDIPEWKRTTFNKGIKMSQKVKGSLKSLNSKNLLWLQLKIIKYLLLLVKLVLERQHK